MEFYGETATMYNFPTDILVAILAPQELYPLGSIVFIG
jgi:hypothetical protein